MAPAKSSKLGHEEAKSDTPNAKDKNSQSGNHQSNGKLRRVASSTGSNLRDAASAASPVPAAQPSGTVAQEQTNPSLQWSAFDRDVLHAYRRAYRLNTPTAFSNEYHQWVLSQPGSIGLHSPTMARKKEFRRQSRDQLSNTVRKHFNGIGIQENEIIVDFLHKVRSQGVSKTGKTKRPEQTQQEMDR